MKILVVCDIFGTVEENPFVRELRNGLSLYGHDVVCNLNEFWNPDVPYDLVFFQWPDAFFSHDGLKWPLKEIYTQIALIKQKKIPTVMTVHNLHPHDNNRLKQELYKNMFSMMDAFHHMGSFSYDMFKHEYPNAYHFIAPHPCYFDSSEVPLSVDECKKKYNLPNKIVVLAFGAFRNEEERKMFVNLRHDDARNCLFWAPKINRTAHKRSLLSKAKSGLFYVLNGIKMEFGPISNEAVKEMVKASDIVFIQRKEILNSGNVPLAFSFGKIVVGPDKGNVGRILRETGNPVFNPDDRQSVLNGLKDALRLFDNNNLQGQRNLDYARKFLSKNYVSNLLNKELLFVSKTSQ